MILREQEPTNYRYAVSIVVASLGLGLAACANTPGPGQTPQPMALPAAGHPANATEKPENALVSDLAATTTVDVLLRGGTIYDGDNDDAIVGDVGITGDRISFVGKPPAEVKGRRTIDATGMIVAPGFIDPHTHADAELTADDPKRRLHPAFLTQGVTTASLGNDGFGDHDIAKRAASLRQHPAGQNTVLFVGFGPVRQSQLGMENVAPDAKQLAAMKRLVAQGMCDGALGLSTGLTYTPQTFARTEEVIELARVAADHGGIYDSHVRNESKGLKDAIDETIRIGREAGLPVHVAHIKTLGADVHGTSGEIVKQIEAARASGVRIHADQYPWLASSTQFSAAVIPSWALAGGREQMLARFDDPAQTEKLRAGIAENLRVRNGPEAILFTAGNDRHVGKTLAEVMKSKSLDAVEATKAVLREGNIAIANFNMDDGDIRTFMKRRWVSTSSDSSDGHPRAYGSFSRKYAEYVVRQKVLSVGEFIRSSTSRPAEQYQLVRRGRLAPGYFADVVVFDPARFAEQATYTEPRRLSVGVQSVLVNGQLAIDDGKVTGLAAGRPLLRQPSKGECPPQRAAGG